MTALFDTPPEQEIEYTEEAEATTTEFRVGPFTYVMSFEPENDRGSIVRVEFKLVDINVPDDELIRMMSKIKKGFQGTGRIQEQEEQPMSLEEAKTMEKQVINNYGHDELEIMGSYVIKVFGTVLGIIKDYRTKYRTNCIIFSADSEDRSRVYQRMMKSAFPRAGIRVQPSPWGAGTEIRVCFI